MEGYFPSGKWYNLFDNSTLDASGGGRPFTLELPLGEVGVHVKVNGSIFNSCCISLVHRLGQWVWCRCRRAVLLRCASPAVPSAYRVHVGVHMWVHMWGSDAEAWLYLTREAKKSVVRIIHSSHA